MISVDTAPISEEEQQAKASPVEANQVEHHQVGDDDLGLFDESSQASEEPASEGSPADNQVGEQHPHYGKTTPAKIRISTTFTETSNDGDEVKVNADDEHEVSRVHDDGGVMIEVDGLGEVLLGIDEFSVVTWSDGSGPDGFNADTLATLEDDEPEGKTAEAPTASFSSPATPTEQQQQATPPPITNYAQSVNDYIGRLQSLESEAEEAEEEVNRLKEELKESKKIYDGKVLELRKAITRPVERLPLFDGPADDYPPAEMPEQDAESQPEQSPEPSQPSQSSDSDVTQDWRSLPIDDLGLPPALTAKLRENPEKTIATLGDLSEWNTTYSITDIKGVGEKKAELIENALDGFWVDHPEFCEK